MKRILHSLEVDLGKDSYSITMGYDILSHCINDLARITPEKRVQIISDSQVYGLYGEKLETLLKEAGYSSLSHVIAPGEESKSWSQAGLILEEMLRKNLSRKTPVLALGGGIVGDLAGFVAAVYRRGVPFIQIPTTLLAQVDSSVGGKVAVNHPLGKNMLGSFYQPAAVWSELSVLGTLPPKEWSAGMAEVLKYALIRDKEFFIFLETNAAALEQKDPGLLPAMVERCCRIKAEVVGRDERDEGLRNILNFGHTIGHALEGATRFKSYRHGEAVAVGMMGALKMAELFGLIEYSLLERVKCLLAAWDLPTAFPSRLKDEVEAQLRFDKKFSAGENVFILIEALGQVAIHRNVPQQIIKEVLEFLAQD